MFWIPNLINILILSCTFGYYLCVSGHAVKTFCSVASFLGGPDLFYRYIGD